MLLAMGWEMWDSADHQDDWNLWWRDCSTKQYEWAESREWHRYNHFPHTRDICRKDMLARILRKFTGIYGTQ